MAARLLIVVVIVAAAVLAVMALRAVWRRTAPPPPRTDDAGRSSQPVVVEGWANTPFWRWVARLAALAALISISAQATIMLLGDRLWPQ